MNTIQDLTKARQLIRSGEYSGITSGWCMDRVQGNLVILPKEQAEQFAEFGRLNPKPCPIIGRSNAGEYNIPSLGEFDLRTDLPGYRIWRGGVATDATDIVDHWRDDLVAFVIGCSFSFDQMLLSAGLELEHIRHGRLVPIYRTWHHVEPVGPFRGRLVVSMRVFKPQDAIRAISITGRFPSVHGEPVHFGDPRQIGINDLQKVDWGQPPLHVPQGHVPVFWACGITPQNIIENNPDIPFAITHQPGKMLITDRRLEGHESF